MWFGRQHGRVEGVPVRLRLWEAFLKGVRFDVSHPREVDMPKECTVEEIGNPDIYADMLGEVVCNNSRIRQRKTEDISEENYCLGPLRGIARRRRGKVIRTDHGALGLTRENKALVAICASHDRSVLRQQGSFYGSGLHIYVTVCGLPAQEDHRARIDTSSRPRWTLPRLSRWSFWPGEPFFSGFYREWIQVVRSGHLAR